MPNQKVYVKHHMEANSPQNFKGKNFVRKDKSINLVKGSNLIPMDNI